MNSRKKELMNTLLHLNKLRRQIEHARFARNMVTNNNGMINRNNIRYSTMNNRMKALIRQTHPYEERVFILSQNMSPASVERVKRLRRVVAVQRKAKKVVQKRRENAARARTMIRRALPVGAHHALTPAQIARFFPALRTAGVVVPRSAHNTRSVTMLSRHLMR
jgi:hypothetical protein